MDISVFIERLQSEIIKIGIPRDRVEKYIRSVEKTLTPDDITGISDYDIIRYAKVCAEQIIKHNPSIVLSSRDAQDDVQDSVPASTDDDEIILLETDDLEDTSVSKSGTDESPSPADALSDSDDEEDESKSVIPDTDDLYEKPTPRGTAMLVLITAVSSPLWLIASILFLAPFVIMFAAEAALTAALVCVLAGVTALGTAASLTGIVYGIVKMFSTPAIGLYEIGFGVIIAGVAMICGILIYNGAVRFMPWLFKKTGRLFKFTFSKVKPLLTEYKRRCRKL